MRPKKKKELVDWIKRRVGKPVINVLIDDTQIDDCIDIACDFFAEHAGGVANENGVLLIKPELVYYDGITNRINNRTDNGPTSGKWRKKLPPFLMSLTVDQLNNLTLAQYEQLKLECGFTTTPSTTGTVSCCPPAFNTATDKIIDPNLVRLNGDCCADEATDSGLGWCKIPQELHCYTDVEYLNPLTEGPFWKLGDSSTIPNKKGFLYKTIYDLEDDIIEVNGQLDQGMFGIGSGSEDAALFSPLGIMMSNGGIQGYMNSNTMVNSSYGSMFGTFFGGGNNFDVVSYFSSMQYLELYRQLFTVKMMTQFNALTHKLTISPAPTTGGIIALSVTKRIVDEKLYTHQGVRDLALAHTLINIGMNSSRYNNLSFPGGASINGELYLKRGDDLREKIEKQITDDHLYSELPEFFIG